MKKIVMLNCLRANSVCTGAACLQAFNAKTKTFARYGDEPLELVAFFLLQRVRCTTGRRRNGGKDRAAFTASA